MMMEIINSVPRLTICVMLGSDLSMVQHQGNVVAMAHESLGCLLGPPQHVLVSNI